MRELNLNLVVLLYVLLVFLNKLKPLMSICTDDAAAVTVIPDNGHYASVNQSYALQGHIISSFKTRRLKLCSGQCTRNAECKSFNYSPGTEVCELSEKTHVSNPYDYVARKGFQYFYYEWSRFTGCSFITSPSHCYQFLFPKLPDGTKHIEFSVKTASDAFIGLSTENRVTNPMYELDIGGRHGVAIFLRSCKSCFSDETISSSNYVSDKEFRRFWITFDNGLVKIGRYQKTVPLVEKQYLQRLSVQYIGFSSWKTNAGEWRLHSFCDAPWEWQS